MDIDGGGTCDKGVLWAQRYMSQHEQPNTQNWEQGHVEDGLQKDPKLPTMLQVPPTRKQAAQEAPGPGRSHGWAGSIPAALSSHSHGIVKP